MNTPACRPAAVLSLALALAAGAPLAAAAAPTGTAPPLALADRTPRHVAFTHARLVVAPGRTIEDGTLVIRDGVIQAVGRGLAVPTGAQERNLAGATVYAGFLDASLPVGLPAVANPPQVSDGVDGPTGGPGAGGRSGFAGPGASSWNPLVTPQRRIERDLVGDSLSLALRKTLRGQGITAALVAPSRGIVKGQGAVLALGDGPVGTLVVRPQATMHVTMATPFGFIDRGYPTSPMGALALIRQSFLDADWYARAEAAVARDPRLPRPEADEGLAALAAWRARAAGALLVVDAKDEFDAARADRLGHELGLATLIRGSGREYRDVAAIKAAGHAIVVPVAFPRPPLVDSPEQAMNISLEELMHWDLAPENPARLAKAGVPFALTSDRLEDKATFLTQVRKAVDRGLSPEAALAALTTTPARLLGVGNRLGTLEPGRLAHLVIADGDIFSRTTKVREVWVDGDAYPVKPWPAVDVRGRWLATIEPAPGTAGDSLLLVVSGAVDSLGGTFRLGRDTKLKSAQVIERRLFLALPGDSLGVKGQVQVSAAVEGDALRGEGTWPDGAPFAVTARRIAPYAAPADTSRRRPPTQAVTEPNLPFGDFGRAAVPAQPAVVAFEGATVWTCGPRGTLTNATVVVAGGKIRAVGPNVRVPAGALRVDARGMHLTPGLVDAHSHTGTDGGVNEGGQNVTAEVRIGDFIEPSDIAIYRELAGGLTAAHVLHGSANAIGGQSQLIKLRWGMSGEAMKFAGWQPTIKFALGENPKQSNFGQVPATRYPQTRMGVEELIRDRFLAARIYMAEQKAGTMANGLPARRDLELEAIAEILRGERIIHCHSYRQDEILMLLRLTEEFGIKVGTFQHILEGYKVADEMAKHGAGGSTFSDWWAYKMEVIDAIPYNGALMHDAGVLVSYNSDSDELARRLNTEAGKAVKYGGVPPEEALKFVTLNPAKQLKVDDRVGSIEPGKDADLALWSGPPLSPLSRCEQTWIDGRRYFDRAEDLAMRAEQGRWKAVLIQRALADDGAGGAGGGSPRRGPARDQADDHGETDDGGFRTAAGDMGGAR